MKIVLFFLLFFSQLAIAVENDCLKTIQSFFEVRTSRKAPLEKQDWMSLGEDNHGFTLVGAKEINDYIGNLINSAKVSLELQTFKMYQKDWVDLLILKAKQGVKIHVQLSAVNHIADFTPERRAIALKLLDLMRENGIVVDEFAPEVLQRKTNVYSPHMHKKLIIVDGKYAYVGSKNLNLHDDSVEFGLGLKGSAVNDLRSLFYKDVANSTKNVKYLDEVFQIGNYSNIGFYNSYKLKDKLIKSIHSAGKSITIGQVEFDDPDVLNALINKKRNSPNVSIKLITMERNKSYTVGPVRFKRALNIEAIKKLQANGIEIYLVDEAKTHTKDKLRFFHGKVTILDNERIILGSSDYTLRGLAGNAELDLEIASPMMAEEFEFYLKNIINDKVAEVSFSKTEVLISRYFEMITNLLMKINKVKKKFAKIELSPEFIELSIRRELGKITQKIIEFKKAYAANFIKDLKSILTPYHKKIILNEIIDDDPLREDEYYTFIGTTSYATTKAKKQGIDKTINGYFGNGYYFANSIETAILYSNLRNGQAGTKGAADILVFKVKKTKMNHFILDASNSNENSALLIEAAEGLGRDYLILQEPNQFKLVKHLKIAI